MQFLVNAVRSLFGVFPRQGCCIAERYKLIEHVRAGSTGDVWKVLDQDNSSEVAVKFALKRNNHPFFTSKVFNDLLAAEAAIHQMVSGINSVPEYVDEGVERGRSYIVMEYLEGQRMYEYLKTKGKIPLGKVVCYGNQMVQGLEAVHMLGLIHADFSTSNLMVNEEKDLVRIFDFGNAAYFYLGLHNTLGIFLGNQVCHALEVIDRGEFSSAADMYSFGVVLYVMATGSLPHRWARISDMKKTVDDVCPELSAHELFYLLSNCLLASPSNRPTAKEAKVELSSLLL